VKKVGHVVAEEPGY